SLTKKSRSENETKGYQQGALFMDEYETFQDEQVEKTKNGNGRYTPRLAERFSEPSVNAQGASPSDEAAWADPSHGEEFAEGNAAYAAAAEDAEAGGIGQSEGAPGLLQLKISNTLHRKLISKAEMEGV